MDGGVGIDLSGLSRSTKGRTVVAALTQEFVVRGIRTMPQGLAGDRELVEWVDELRPRTVAVDAPLSLPHGVGCQDTNCQRCLPGSADYMARDVDRQVNGMPTVMLAAIAFRGIFLARLLRHRGITVIETYPRAAYEVLGVPRSSPASIQVLSAALQQRIGRVDFSTRDDLDALAAATVAVDHSLGRAQSVPGADGEIWLPAPDAYMAV